VGLVAPAFFIGWPVPSRAVRAWRSSPRSGTSICSWIVRRRQDPDSGPRARHFQYVSVRGFMPISVANSAAFRVVDRFVSDPRGI